MATAFAGDAHEERGEEEFLDSLGLLSGVLGFHESSISMSGIA